MKYHPIDNALFVSNRKNLYKRLKPKSMVIVLSNDIMPTNADGTMRFKQNSNQIYLSGIDQEETVTVLCPDFPDEQLREVLFIRETSEEIAIWEGAKYTKEEAEKISGIANIKWNHLFEQTLNTLMPEVEHIYLETNEHIRNANEVETRTDRFIKWCREKYPLHEYERLSPLIYDLRTIKAPQEIKLIHHACDITESGFRRVLDYVEPGVWEYQIEAEYVHEFLMHRSRGFAYEPIVASGGNACVLHYLQNNNQCQDGDLLLMDVGAEYSNYNADMTRTIPVNGRFTKRQRAIYDAVHRVKTEATDMLRPGTSIQEYHKEVGKVMESELITLGLLDKNDVRKQDPERPLYKKYFMHGTSHQLGLDVHDVGSVYKPMEVGMVFTVEPGIYIRDENIGVRLEDNIVITDKGHDNLMRNIPIHAEEIEDLMNRPQ